MEHNSLIRNAVIISSGFLVTYYLIFGTQGLAEYFKYKQELENEKKSIVRLEKNIQQLDEAINQTKNNSFEIEKVARYDFAMGYTNEIVYVLPQTHAATSSTATSSSAGTSISDDSSEIACGSASD